MAHQTYYKSMTLSDFLNDKMAQLGMNMSKFAEYLKVARSDLSRVVNKRREPSMTMAQAIFEMEPTLEVARLLLERHADH
jgi:plasmid maintenance system antidote protein VapI